MGESFGIYQLGDDKKIMPLITDANIACGFHASDPNWMHTTVALAKKYSVRVGAHFSLPDLLGFGRREMTIERKEIFNIIVYQVGALSGFLKYCDVSLSHLKAHGSLYGMASKYEHIAEAIADVAEIYSVPVFGLSNTIIEAVCKQRNIPFKAEFFADLDYDDNSNIIITRRHKPEDPETLGKKCLLAVEQQQVKSVNNTLVPVKAETICVHSDTPNATDVLISINKTLGQYLNI